MELRDIRHAQGLTMKQVAEKANLSESVVCLIENGKRNPSLKTAKKLATALGVTVDELIGKEEAS
jgi:putative transcriptional regulator